MSGGRSANIGTSSNNGMEPSASKYRADKMRRRGKMIGEIDSRTNSFGGYHIEGTRLNLSLAGCHLQLFPDYAPR